MHIHIHLPHAYSTLQVGCRKLREIVQLVVCCVAHNWISFRLGCVQLCKQVYISATVCEYMHYVGAGARALCVWHACTAGQPGQLITSNARQVHLK